MAKTALITGASGGIGLELASLFAADKTDLVLVARSEQKLQELAANIRKSHGVQVHVLAFDLSVIENAAAVIAYCKENNLFIYYLVNNAGFGDFGFFSGTDWNKQLQMINLNITALTHLTRLFLPAMLEKREGKIMNVASTAAFQPGPLMSVYFATKAFVLSFSEALSDELSGTGITVTILCPGPTDTGFLDAASLQKNRLIEKNEVSAASVAAFGYRSMMKGRVVAIDGFLNTVAATSIRFFPRFLVRKLVRRLQEKGVKK